MLVLLDSTVLIDFLRGRPVVDRVRALRDSGREAATTAVNVEEIVRGMRPGEEPSGRALVAGLVVLPVTEAVAWRAGEWRREFAARGVTLWQADCLIAAVAAGAGAVLATGNPADFPMLTANLEHWPVGA